LAARPVSVVARTQSFTMAETPKRHWIHEHALHATEALIKFMEDHKQGIDDDLRKCGEALRNGDIPTACRFAYRAKPWGMGSLTDCCLQPAQGEDQKYSETVFDALIRYWCFWLSALADKQDTFWRRLLRAIGSYGK